MLKPLSPWFASSHYIITKKNCSIFCGYYDLQPFRPSASSQVLVHILDHTSPSNDLQLGIYNAISNSFNIFDSSEAWNFQQGSRLHWLSDYQIVYNKLSGKYPVAIIYDIHANEYLKLPISFNISDSSRNIYSLDYGHLANCSEYGYSQADPTSYPLRVTMLLHEYNYSLEKCRVIDVPKYAPNHAKVDKHHINHLLPSPTHSFVIAIERYYINQKRFDNLVVFNFNNLTFVRVIEMSLISHYCFLDHHTLLLWGKLQSGLEGYYKLYFSESGRLIHSEYLYSFQDGHPSAIDSNTVITEVPHGSLFVDNFNLIIEMSMKRSAPILYGLLPLIYPISSSRRCDTHISVSYDKSVFQADYFSSLNRRSVVVFNRA